MTRKQSADELGAALSDFRRAVLDHERWAAREIVRAYRQAWEAIRERINALLGDMQRAQKAGEIISPAWLFQYNRLEDLRRQIEQEIARFARYAGEVIGATQEEVALMGAEHAETLVRLAMEAERAGVTIPWNRLPTSAIREIIGATQPISPLRRLLDALPGEVGQAAADALVQGVILGQHPRQIARALRMATGMGLVRARRIARTEVLRAYREVTRQSYIANRDVVKGWEWRAALDDRTCPMCWAMHGTVHSFEETLDDHPNGRCAMVPVLKSWEELGVGGVPERPRERITGEELFAQLPEERQRRVLGNAAFEAYRAGEVRLADFVGRRWTPEWGSMRYARSLRSILGNNRATQWRQRAIERVAYVQ